MRPIFAIVFSLLLAGWVQAQDLSASNAPKAFMGFSFGSSFATVSSGLKQAGTTVRADPAPGRDGVQKISVPRQSLDKIENVTVELVFFQDRLFQIGATLAYKPEILKGLTEVLGDKYGPVKSLDGGYSSLWFFSAKGPTTGNPDFAIVLRNDPVSSKSIVLTYVDNRVRKNAPPLGSGTGNVLVPPVADPTPPALDSSSF